MDRPDIRYAASTMGRQASSPKDADMVRLKRVERFLLGRPITCDQTESWHTRTVIGQQSEDRRSVSGGMLVHNGGLLKFLVKKAEGGVTVVVGE